MPLKKRKQANASSSQNDLHCCNIDKWICQIVQKSQPSYIENRHLVGGLCRVLGVWHSCRWITYQ